MFLFLGAGGTPKRLHLDTNNYSFTFLIIYLYFFFRRCKCFHREAKAHEQLIFPLCGKLTKSLNKAWLLTGHGTKNKNKILSRETCFISLIYAVPLCLTNKQFMPIQTNDEPKYFYPNTDKYLSVRLLVLSCTTLMPAEWALCRHS